MSSGAFIWSASVSAWPKAVKAAVRGVAYMGEVGGVNL